jgi:dTDP-4-dehydrorhamnose 3,5-epimerase
MQVERLLGQGGEPVLGPLLITPRLFADPRGFFFESWNQEAFAAALEADGQPANLAFVQDNHSRSAQGVLRGLHYQLPPHPQGKLVRCVVGAIWDLAVDLRRSSPSFGQWVAARLDADRHQQLWIPAGFAHGFLVLSPCAEVLYKTTDLWTPACERAIHWADPTLAIPWHAQLAGETAPQQPLLSEKDSQAPTLAEAVAAGALFP